MKTKLSFSAMLLFFISLIISLQPLLAQTGAGKKYDGTIGDFAVRMTLQRNGNELTGSYLYKKVGKPIQLKGRVNGQQIVIDELNEQGMVTGSFKGNFENNGNLIIGDWAKAGSKRTLPFNLDSERAGETTTEQIDAEDRAIITEKFVAIKTPKSETVKEINISYPVVSGLKNSPALRKVQAAVSLKSVFEQSLEELRAEADGSGIVGISYQINYDKNFLLDITFTADTLGAYPDVWVVRKLINLKTGEPLKAADAFNRAKLNQLLSMLQSKLKAEITHQLAEIKQNEPDIEDPASIFEGKVYQLEDLNSFSVSDKGVTFIYRYEFAHVIKALEPAGEFFFSYEQLKPFINPNGPLAVFAK